MDRCSVLPDDPDSCRELLRRLQHEQAVLEQQRAALTRELAEQRRVLDETAASYAELQQQHEALLIQPSPRDASKPGRAPRS